MMSYSNVRRSLLETDLDKLESVLSESRNDFRDDSELFYKKNIFKMARFMQLYCDLMTHLNIHVLEDVEEELSQYDLDDRLRLFLQNWDNFLELIEQNANLKSDSDEILSRKDDIFANEHFFTKIASQTHQNLSLVELHKDFLASKSELLDKNKPCFMHVVMLRHFAW